MPNNSSTSIKVAGADARVLGDADPVQLFCGISGCDSNCCTKSAPIILNPYELSLICRESGMSYEDLLDIVDTERAKGFPLVMLPRDPACHFWTGRGCRIYSARPLACRLYPLGRVFDRGRSHIVLPERNVCAGLSQSPVDRIRRDLTARGRGPASRVSIARITSSTMSSLVRVASTTAYRFDRARRS